MGQQDAAQAAVLVSDHRLNQRQMQEEALESLYAVTSVAGFALAVLALQLGQLLGTGLLRVLLGLVPLALHALLARHYLAGAWALVLTWLGTALALISSLPGTPTPCNVASPHGPPRQAAQVLRRATPVPGPPGPHHGGLAAHPEPLSRTMSLHTTCDFGYQPILAYSTPWPRFLTVSELLIHVGIG